MKKTVILLSVALCLILLATTAFAAQPVNKSKGQIVFVGAAYIDLSYYRDGDFINQSTITKLVIRNIDPDNSITLVSVDFYDPDGSLEKEYLESPIVIDPLIAVEYLAAAPTLGIPPYEQGQGLPCFLVEWEADKIVNAPIIGADISKVRDDGTFIEFLSSSNVQGVVIKEK